MKLLAPKDELNISEFRDNTKWVWLAHLGMQSYLGGGKGRAG